MERIRYKLNSQDAKTNVDNDINIKLTLDGKQKILPEGDLIKILDVNEQFNKERQTSPFYRLIGTLKPIVSNSLFNITGDDGWNVFNKSVFKVDVFNQREPLSYKESLNKHLKNIDGWYGYFDLSTGITPTFKYMFPGKDKFEFSERNWDITVTYPFSSDTKQYVVDGGLIIVDKRTVTVGGVTMVALATPVRHNLNIGDVVKLDGLGVFNGNYNVIRDGLDDGSFQGYFFCIRLNPANVILNVNTRMTKIINGFESEYYYRLFKKIKTRTNNTLSKNSKELYNAAFSQTIYNDQIKQYIITEDIDISNLVDNLNRPLSEIYVTFIKRKSTANNGSTEFSDIKSGIEAPFIDNLKNTNINPKFLDIPIIQRIHDSGTQTPFVSPIPLESNINIDTFDYFYGDIVEYNKTTQREIVLADIYHRFNTLNRNNTTTVTNNPASGPRYEGYYYKAHHLIQIRQFSNYIEEANSLNVNIVPDYAVNLGDGRIIWRDLLDIGVSDTDFNPLNYPFLNGCHYLYKDYCFDIRRQDPYRFWELLYIENYPNDPIGDRIGNNIFVNRSQDVC